MKIFYLIAIAALSITGANAQNSIRPNIYVQDLQYYNPASLALDSGDLSQTAIYGKYKFVGNAKGIWHKPMNVWLSHAARIGQKNAFYTISYVRDDYSFFDRNAVYLGYVRQINLGERFHLNYGGRVVANIDLIDWDDFRLPHTESGRSTRFNPDLDLGMSFQLRNLKAGVGLKNVIGTSTKLEDAVLIKNHFEINAHLAYKQNFGKQFSVTPFLLLANERSTLIDAGLSFSMFNRLQAAYALRVNELKSVITLNVGLSKNFSMGAAYDRSGLVSDHNVDFVLRYRR